MAVARASCPTAVTPARFSVGDTTLIAPVIPGPTTPADFRPFVSPDDRFNFGPFNFLQIPLERVRPVRNGQAELTEQREPDAQGHLEPAQIAQPGRSAAVRHRCCRGHYARFSTIPTIDATNPFNPFGVTLDSTNFDFIFRRFVEGGTAPLQPDRQHHLRQSRPSTASSSSLNGDWFWDINAAWGQNKAKQRMFGNINSGNLRTALGPLATCNATPGCVPFNLFGGAGSITQAMMDYVTFIQRDKSEQTTWDFTGNVSGNLFELPGGPLGLALGVEYRKLKGRFDPDPVVAAGFSSDIPALPTRGQVQRQGSLCGVECSTAVRRAFRRAARTQWRGARVRLLDVGSTTTFKGGVNWKPIRDLRLRGSYAEGFRAPSIGELFGTASRFDQQLDDPCSSHVGNTAPANFQNNATVRANCIAAGVPADGSYQQANPQISVIVGGNENLLPETSKSWIFGGVYSPSFIPRLSVEVNHYNIKIDGAIQTVDAEVTLTNCVVNNDPAACALVTRAAGAGSSPRSRACCRTSPESRPKASMLNSPIGRARTSIGPFGFTWNNTFLQELRRHRSDGDRGTGDQP